MGLQELTQDWMVRTREGVLETDFTLLPIRYWFLRARFYYCGPAYRLRFA
jgi:hypothetical protein